MRSAPIRFPVYSPILNGNEKKYVNECLDSTWISSKGRFIDAFEKTFAQTIKVRSAISVCNGTVALHLALKALELNPGDEVIVPTLTYVASVNAIVQAGCTPVFADCLAQTWQIDPQEIERKISPRTKAVMAVHLYGHSCEMRSIQNLCRKHNLFLIEDCAEAFGTYFDGRHAGSFGDIATFSFFGNKTITTGEGGMVVSNNTDLIKYAYCLKTQGVSLTKAYWHEVFGYNYRMTNICAAIGLAQLEQAESIIDKKRQIAVWYQSELENLPLQTDPVIEDGVSSYWMCSILLDEPEDRDPLRSYLAAQGIETRPFFYPAHQLPIYTSSEPFPIAESLSARGINLPSYPQLTQENVAEIASHIHRFFQ